MTLLQVVEADRQDANGPDQSQQVVSPFETPYQPVDSLQILSSTKAAREYESGYLSGWTAVAVALWPGSSLPYRKDGPTLISQRFQPMVTGWTGWTLFGEETRSLPASRGFAAGWVAACDAAFGVSR